MGQGHHGGILFGALTDGRAFFGDDNGDDSIIDKYEHWLSKSLPKCRRHPGFKNGMIRDPKYFERKDVQRRGAAADRRFLLPDTPYETKPSWVGFWVADIDNTFASRDGYCEAGAPHESGVLQYTALPLSEAGIKARFPKALKSAMDRWAAFEAFCKRRRVEISGQLLIVTDWD